MSGRWPRASSRGRIAARTGRGMPCRPWRSSRWTATRSWPKASRRPCGTTPIGSTPRSRRSKGVFSMEGATLCAFYFRELRRRGLMTPEDEARAKRLLLCLRQYQCAWRPGDGLWRGSHHRSQCQGINHALAAAFYPDGAGRREMEGLCRSGLVRLVGLPRRGHQRHRLLLQQLRQHPACSGVAGPQRGLHRSRGEAVVRPHPRRDHARRCRRSLRGQRRLQLGGRREDLRAGIGGPVHP